MATRNDLEVLIREIRQSDKTLDDCFRVLYFYLKGEMKTALKVLPDDRCQQGKYILQDSLKSAEEFERKEIK